MNPTIIPNSPATGAEPVEVLTVQVLGMAAIN